MLNEWMNEWIKEIQHMLWILSGSFRVGRSNRVVTLLSNIITESREAINTRFLRSYLVLLPSFKTDKIKAYLTCYNVCPVCWYQYNSNRRWNFEGPSSYPFTLEANCSCDFSPNPTATHCLNRIYWSNKKYTRLVPEILII